MFWTVPLWITVRTALLFALFCLHIFWWLLLNRIGMKVLGGQKGHEAGDEEYEITMKDEKKER